MDWGASNEVPQTGSPVSPNEHVNSKLDFTAQGWTSGHWELMNGNSIVHAYYTEWAACSIRTSHNVRMLLIKVQSQQTSTQSAHSAYIHIVKHLLNCIVHTWWALRCLWSSPPGMRTQEAVPVGGERTVKENRRLTSRVTDVAGSENPLGWCTESELCMQCTVYSACYSPVCMSLVSCWCGPRTTL